MTYLIVRIFKQILNDKRLLVLITIAPLLIMTLIYYLLGTTSFVPKIGVDAPLPFVAALKQQNAIVSSLDVDQADQLLEDRAIDAAVYLADNKLTIKILENDAFRMSAVTTAVREAAKEMLRTTGLLNPLSDMQIVYLHGTSGVNLFAAIGYIMLGIIAFFFTFILAGIAFIRERSQGTLERFILSPIKRWQIIAGYTIAYGTLAMIQSTVILLYANYVLGMNIGSAIPAAMLIMMLMSITAVSVCILISVASHNEFQVVQFIPILVLPQVFFSGLIPLDLMPYHLGTLAYIMPLYYACDALKHVIVYGQGLVAIGADLAILAGLLIILTSINTLILKQFRRI
jgi:ABC-2 type transport system permease protein